MTGINNNNKYVPQAPKTYEVRYVEYKEPSKIVQFANYLGMSTAHNCSSCSAGSAGRDKYFELNIILCNAMGAKISSTVYNTDSAASAASDIVISTGHWEGTFGTGGFRQKNRNNLSEKINEAVRRHNKGNSINETVTNDD